MATIYEINDAINECIDMETGEIADFERLDALLLERNEKIENIALFIKNEKAMAESIKTEKMSLAERQKRHENRAKSLEDYLEHVLDGSKFETGKVAISYRKSETVEIDDISYVPAKYLKWKDPEADKTAIKAAIKSGEEFEGIRIETHQRMQIK